MKTNFFKCFANPLIRKIIRYHVVLDKSCISVRGISGAQPQEPSGSLSLARRPKLLPFKNYGGHCTLGNLQYSRNFLCSLLQICNSTRTWLWALQEAPLSRPHALFFFLWYTLSSIRPHTDRCVKSCPTSWTNHSWISRLGYATNHHVIFHLFLLTSTHSVSIVPFWCVKC